MKTCEQCGTYFDARGRARQCGAEACRKAARNERAIGERERAKERARQRGEIPARRRNVERAEPPKIRVAAEPTGLPCALDGCDAPAIGDEFCSTRHCRIAHGVPLPRDERVAA